jgi:predicted GNAT superfamily acetyltransferase
MKLREFSIRPAASVSECKDSNELQLQVWGFQEREVIPVHMLRALSDEGLVLNAYDNAGKVIGTSAAFLAKRDRKLILYSHITGVVPQFQSKGVGAALKLAQRKYAIEHGLDLVCWTYDPMQSLNNWFNLNKLGAIARTYFANYYGDMPDDLNRGVESDRFLAEWWVRSPRVRKTLSSRRKIASEDLHCVIVNPSFIKDGVRHPSAQQHLEVDEKSILIEIPSDHEELRKRDLSILQRWRAETRRLYLHCFRRGYVATGALVDESEGKRSFVKLERRSLQRILQN